MFVQTIVFYNHLVFCTKQHFECEYSNVIPKDALLSYLFEHLKSFFLDNVTGNSCAKLQTKQIILKAGIKISSGVPIFLNHPVYA